MRRALIVLLLTVPAIAQSLAPKPGFEVVSVKENQENSGPPIWTPQRSGDRVILRKVRPDIVIDYAWHIGNGYEVVFPGNMPLEWWDIEAKITGAPDEDKLRLMFQSMLEDRFNVKTHYEQREIDKWDLVVSKPGKLKPADPESTMTVSGRPMRPGIAAILAESDGHHLVSSGCSIAQIVDSFSRVLHSPVTNKTNLDGIYQYNILLDEDPPNIPSVADRELGLKFVRS